MPSLIYTQSILVKLLYKLFPNAPLLFFLALVSATSPGLAESLSEPPLAPAITHKQALQGGVGLLDGVSGRAENKLNLTANAGRSSSNTSSIANFIELPPVTGHAQSERVEPIVFRAWLSKAHPELVLNGSLNDFNPVIEVAGQWDKADKTLTKLQIPFRHVKAREISSELLAGAKVLIVNCPGEVKRDKLQSIQDFVKNGGYLLSTDWALDNMLTQTFPGYVSWNKGVNRKDIYDADYQAPDAVLAVNTVRSAFWKLDQSSHLIHIIKPGAVHILVTSRQLAGDDPDKAGILAVIFPFGRGYVLHMVGHFDNNAKIAIGNFLPDSAPAIGISLRQAIAANFVVAGLTGKRLPY